MILLLGSAGQLGTSIAVALSRKKYDFFAADNKTLDVTKAEVLHSYISFLKPKIIINASAYTDVNKAEQEHTTANVVNCKAIQNIQEVCDSIFSSNTQPVILHYSTDYVFDGQKTQQYIESDITKPLNHYGRSKRDGENVLIQNYKKFFIIRTSWLFSQYGGNFVKNIVKALTTTSTQPISIVNDQFGSPTSAHGLANLTILIIEKILEECSLENFDIKQRYGVYHFSGQNKMTWFDFGNIIRTYCQLHTNAPLRSIRAQKSDVNAQVKRPYDSVLNCNKISQWLSLSPEFFSWQKDCHYFIKTLLCK